MVFELFLTYFVHKLILHRKLILHNFDKMIDECIENIETITNLEPNNYDDLL